MKYHLHHAPMPKSRVMFVLSEPFDFTAGSSQRVRMDEWKELYAKVSDWLGVAYDSSCTDPSRLMYTPRRPAESEVGEGRHEIILFDGDFLDLSAVPETSTFAANFTKFAEEEKVHHTFETPGLMAFAKKCPDFDIMGFMESMLPDEKRGHSTDPDKAEWACPNEDSHTKQDANDRGFFVSTNGEYWHAQCLHDGCKQSSQDDRLWYLDKLCVKAGITDARELEAWSASAQEFDQKDVAAEKVADDPDALKDAVEAINKDSTPEEIDAVLLALGKVASSLYVESSLRHMVQNTGKRFTAAILKKRMAELKKATLVSQASQSEVDELGIPIPPKDLSKSAPIWREWGYKIGMEATLKQLLKANDKDPFLFTRTDGTLARLIETQDLHGHALRIEKLAPPQLAAVVNKRLHFKKIDRDAQRPIDSACENQIVSDLCFDENPPWPTLRGVSRVPVFTADGTIRTERGYDPVLRVYVDPQEDWLPVPDTVTDDDLQDALAWLHELVRDVPFSDAFDEPEELRQMTSTIGDDGWPIPNWKRGHASRLHYFAMILQTFVRYAIDGSCPAYHIDKHDHGEGGTLLANMLSIIVEGKNATATALPVRDEEINKTVTTALVEGAPILLFDNIPSGKVSSPEMALALTAGQWKARLLGTNVNAYVPILNVWVWCGVNLRFHDELVRRNIPIKINSKVANPSMRDAKMFKHNPGEKYALENRKQLVWACCVLIRNWYQQGNPEAEMPISLNSFTDWSRVMGGIFHAAGLDGFLDTVGIYQRLHKSEGVVSPGALAALYKRAGTELFTATQALEYLKNPFGAIEFELPIQGNSEAGLAASLGRWLSKDVMGKTLEIESEAGELIEVTLLKRHHGGVTKYKFELKKPDEPLADTDEPTEDYEDASTNLVELDTGK
jgi:hypothetical protein